MSYYGPERRAHALTDEEMDAIAEKAAQKALQKVYAEVGKGILNKVAWVLGSATIAVLLWLGGKGIILK
jgi:hypothetical protein